MNRTQDHRAGDGADYRGADYRGAGAEGRPARAAHLPALCDFFTGLSMQTRYLRFFSPVTPGPALLHLLAGGAGTTDAVLATRGRVIIGHAMATERTGPRGTRMNDNGMAVADT